MSAALRLRTEALAGRAERALATPISRTRWLLNSATAPLARTTAGSSCQMVPAGNIFPIPGGWLGDLDDLPLAFSICGIGCVIGALASAIVYPPHHDEATQHFSVHGFLHYAHYAHYADHADHT